MPSFNFIIKETGEEVSHFMKFSEIEEFLKANLHLERGVDRPGVINHNLVGVKGAGKPDSGFRDVLSKIKAAHPHGSVNNW